MNLLVFKSFLDLVAQWTFEVLYKIDCNCNGGRSRSRRRLIHDDDIKYIHFNIAISIYEASDYITGVTSRRLYTSCDSTK